MTVKSFHSVMNRERIPSQGFYSARMRIPVLLTVTNFPEMSLSPNCRKARSKTGCKYSAVCSDSRKRIIPA